MFCSFCGQEVPSQARFCAKCGRAVAVAADTDETVMGEEGNLEGNLETLAPETPRTPQATPRPTPRPGSKPPMTPAKPRSGPPSNPNLMSSDPIGGGRFTPGEIVAERYRIVGLLGRGGMGEVYRAEDLKLSQVLAIKFLPQAVSQDAPTLARFHSEVRVARQVSHPNVCRVFDIGDAEGVPFLTMEYVDGEDLSSLVRRIGRLPQDKAAEVSRQMCAGLAAAHERGVVHRDLKPSNIMLDGAGKVRITDFGLAGIAANIQGAEVRAGTPAYMAPEQLSGKEVTTKSDIYSLGLVMYEILTGKRAFEAATLGELRKAREEGKLTSPSTLVRDLDPLLERVIMRCLETDPGNRPVSALQVAAALPGGDPLAAALAAGETPSPEMVAAAGEKEGTRPGLALACFLTVVTLVSACTYFGYRESGLRKIDPQYSTEVMEHKAREIVASLGYEARPRDTASGYSYEYDFLEYLNKKDKPGAGWNRVLTERPPVLQFWYRQSPEEMVADGFWNLSITPGVVTQEDPQETFSGMVNLRLDTTGRLIYFQAIPPQKQEQPPATAAADWHGLFAAAGLNEADFHSAPAIWNPLVSGDTRAAWDGMWPGTNRELHIEAVAWHGRPVYFLLAGPWTKPRRMLAPGSTGAARVQEIFEISLPLLVFIGGLWLAYRNFSRGKGDRRGALRMAGVVFVLELILFLVRAHLSLTQNTLGLLVLAASTGLFVSGVFWVLYLALEPYVRSKWPQTIVSWSRLLTGKLRDPLVGRDILFGTVLGTAWVFVFDIGYFFQLLAGERPPLSASEVLGGARTAGAWCLINIVNAILGVLMFFFVLVFLRALVRNRWLAAALFVVLFSTPHLLSSNHLLSDTPVWVIIYGIAAFAVVRFGLIALATAVFTANVLLNVPYTLDFSKWYATESVCIVLSFVALAGWGFYTSLAGQRVWKGELFE